MAELPPEAASFYRNVMLELKEAGIPYLVGGAFAFGQYTGIHRHTKDFDLFIRHTDVDAALGTLEAAGYKTELTFPHWLAKAYSDAFMIDLIFRSGNSISKVDDRWFDRAVGQQVLGIDVHLCPPEEIIWTKSYIMERERYDGADVSHLILRHADQIDWDRLVELFGAHWRVLFSHLVLFGFIYPSERDRIPQEVIQALSRRLEAEMQQPPESQKICRGTLLSRAQYLIDIDEWGFKDARLRPHGGMTPEQVEQWTDSIGNDHLPEEQKEKE